ncbi:MAG TPA: hypothetical protein VG734_07300 [Lacunisphaera sp.]|nr:hypothetical protein [Lacunisphaera sp.]
MNLRHLLSLTALVGLCLTSRADSILLSDDFSGASLDTSKWQTLGPGSVSQSGGFVTTQGRGILATQAGFNAPYVINGAFTMLDGLEHFNVAFRTDLSTPGAPFYERAGMLVSFSNDGNQISIQRYTSPSDWDLLAVKSYTLTTGLTYFFSIFDDGTNIDFSVNGVQELSASSSYSTGDHIALLSREFGAGSKIDAVTVARVPEAGMTGWYAGAVICFLWAVRKNSVSETVP